MIKKDSRDILLSVLGILLIIVSAIGISYAIYVFSLLGEKENIINTGTINMEYDESEDKVIKLEGAIPVSDQVGMVQNEYFDFSIKASIAGKATISYEIRAKKIPVTGLQLGDEEVKLYLEKRSDNDYVSVMNPCHFTLTPETSVNNSSVDKNTMLLYRGSFSNNTSAKKNFREDYRLRMWIDDQTIIGNDSKTYKIKVDVYASLNN